MFAHAPYPLARTMQYRGDPGLFGPGSATWPIIGDAAAFAGGLRALLVQAAHPEVVAGVADHSSYRDDPLGRLSRTSAYVTATSFGARPEVDRAVQVVRHAHRKVVGVSHRGRPYAADNAALAAWVHNSLTDGFLTAYRAFGPRRLAAAEADRFVAEQTAVGALLGSDPLPDTAAGLSAWITTHPDLGPSPGMEEAIAFLRSPPLRPAVKAGYRVLFAAAVATLPPQIREILGVKRRPGTLALGRVMIRFLRWNLGSSPSWNLALIRSGAPVPTGMFRQPLPVEVNGRGRGA